MNKNLSAILFDFNGTMFDDAKYHQIAWDEISLTYRSCKIRENELANMHGLTNSAIIKKFFDSSLSYQKINEISQEKEARYRKICLNTPNVMKLMPGLKKLLNDLLKDKVPMNICSASIKENMDFFIKEFHLDTYFDSSKIQFDDGKNKDKVSMFKKGAELLEKTMEECIVFEDSVSGIACAKAAKAGYIVRINTDNRKDMSVDETISSFENWNYQPILSHVNNKSIKNG